ncbi:hypothetical protein RxyAA322_28830 [Rubrobacter xylanophilus]|uniref:Terpene synthase n=1 Tax=Rubrobacter xylanophilus TaxID=49319 RepID=A0A510HLZ3_9ACTN|nr:hypothetical protein [Rubrobacter xylanophilus]BBL81029.1 hypothetical protein RxyAA322_28830 [Rubrobacter xylanophilus]
MGSSKNGMVRVPRLRCPFPAAMNPHADGVHRETVEWAEGFGLLASGESRRMVRDTQIGRLAGRFHPCAGREELRLISDWCAWMFLRDDLADDPAYFRHPERLAALDAAFLDILSGRISGEEHGPFGRALRDLRERLLPKVPGPLWLRRFLRSVEEHFESTLWEATNRARGVTPDLATYVRMRPITGGMHVDTDFIEVTSGIYLPPEVHRERVVSSLTEASNNVVCWANDIISLAKERSRGDVHNLVLVLCESRRLPLGEAVAEAVRMYEAEVRRFVRLEKELPSFGPAVDDNLRRYVWVLKTRMRGNLEWTYESARYRVGAASP